MAKFTVFFKDKAIHSEIFESGVIHIGRNDANDLIIDSLAIAPTHASVVVTESVCTIKQLNADFPLIINDETIQEHELQNSDVITIGKHRIMYSDSAALPPTLHEHESVALNEELSKDSRIPEANLQVMGGKYIGRLIPLKKNMTRLGHAGAGIIIVTRRKSGYYASMLEPNDEVSINNTPIKENTILLKNDDVLLVDNVPMQFFIS